MAGDSHRNVFQKIAGFFEGLADWVEETFADPELGRQVRDDLGLDTSNPATPKAVDPAVRQKIDDFLAKEDVDKATFLATVGQLKALAETVLTFADAVKADGVDAWDVFWLVFKVWVADSLRIRNPSAYALCQIAGLVLEDDETLAQLDPAPVQRLLKGEATGDDADAWVDRLSALGGAAVVLADQESAAVGGVIDALYGWDPEPGTAPEAAVAASRMLTVLFRTGDVVNPLLTVVAVPREQGGPGLLISAGARLHLEHDTGSATYVTDVGADGAFSLFFRFSLDDPAFRSFGGGTASVGIGVEPKTDGRPAALVLGISDATRLEIGGFAYGVELGADHAGFKAHVRKGKLTVTLSDGDGFLSRLPGGKVEIPFDLGLLADTAHGVRFDGGTGLKVDLPVAASLFGVFTVQSLSLELKLAGTPALEVRGAFSLRLGPFQATVDQIGSVLDLAAISQGVDDIGSLVRFAPPKGIGLALDLGPVKGGGYLFIDPDAGEYAGALELKFLAFSIKAIALVSTRRPDGSDNWALLIFVFGQFHVHIAFGIFWTGLGGMIGLHHRADTDALTAGMRTGALDDVLFPDNPVADAPRIIARYKQLFPIEDDTLLLGPMLELSFSEPPIVYVRLGLVFEVANALGGDRPAQLTKVILLGQLLVQLPPKDTGLPAIVKLLVDVVGFYDAVAQFLLIRARLRDSFVGIEGFAKLDLTGELVLAMHFGDDPSFVLSAGGFHPAFKDVPAGVPTDLERLAVSFGIGPIKIRSEQYFALTSNSVQGGLKIELSADIDVAAIKGHLAFDALLYLSPRFYFLVQLDFAVSLEAFGESLCAVGVHMELEGPGAWHAKGHFSFSILWWDVDIDFDQRWGEPSEVEPATTSAAQLLRDELSNPDRLLPGPPVGGNALVTLAPLAPGEALAHPLGLLSIAQKAVPLDVQIDRIGTRKLVEGTPTFSVTSVTVGGTAATATQPVLDHFARGQFMELTDQQKLEGRSFETFPSGVQLGSSGYAVPTDSTTVTADYEVEILDPQPTMNLHWVVRDRLRQPLAVDTAVRLASYGAAARSARAVARALHPEVGKALLAEPPMAVVDRATLQEKVAVTSAPASSEAVADQFADRCGGLVVEAWEVAR